MLAVMINCECSLPHLINFFLSKQVELYCNSKGLSIVGYYHANERLEDMTLTETAKHTATKIATSCENKGCLLLVNPLIKLALIDGNIFVPFVGE